MLVNSKDCQRCKCEEYPCNKRKCSFKAGWDMYGRWKVYRDQDINKVESDMKERISREQYNFNTLQNLI